MNLTDYTHYKSLSMLLQDVLIAYIKPGYVKPEFTPEFLKRKVTYDEASQATKYRRVSEMHSLVCNHLLPEDTDNVADEIALLARQFVIQHGQLNADQKQLLSGLDDHARFEDQDAEVEMNLDVSATMNQQEQNKRNILINSMQNQRQQFNLKEKVLAVQLFQSYYKEDLELFTSAKNTNTDIDKDTTIDTIYNGALNKAYAELKDINIYKVITKRQYKRWCLNNGMRKSSSRINFEFEQWVWGELIILNTS
jgi:hypothetical protein